MVLEQELQHYQVKLGYLGFMNLFFICVQLISMQVALAEHHNTSSPSLKQGAEVVISWSACPPQHVCGRPDPPHIPAVTILFVYLDLQT